MDKMEKLRHEIIEWLKTRPEVESPELQNRSNEIFAVWDGLDVAITANEL